MTSACPIVNSISNVTSNEDTSVAFTVTSANRTSESVSYSLDATSVSRGMSINASTGAFSWPAASIPQWPTSNTNYGVTVTANYSGGGSPGTSSQRTFTITITPVNDAPTFTNSAGTTATEGVAYSYDANATDIEGNSYSFSLISSPVGMTVNSSTGVVSWTPPQALANYTQNVTLRVTDSAGAFTNQSWTINVTAVNNAPTFTSTPITAATESVAYSYTASATDPEGQALTYSLFSAPAWLSFNVGTRQLTGTPPEATANYTANVTLRVSDGTNLVSQVFIINVTADNDAPAFSTVPVTSATESTLYSYTANATDPESQALTFSLFSGPAWLSFNAGTRVLSGTPPEAIANYTANVTLRVSDGTNVVNQNFTINVTADNDAPVFASSPETTAAEGVAYVYKAIANDPESQALTFGLLIAPAGMTINADDGIINWTPPEALSDYAVNVTVRVSDGTHNVNQAFSITVSADNDAPVFTTVPLTAATESTLYSYVVNALDPESQALTFSLFSGPAWLSFNPATRVLSGTPPEATANYTADVTLRVSDGSFTTNQSFTITISADNDAPAFSTAPVTVGAEGVLYSYVTNATDPENQALTFSLFSGPAWLSFNPGTRVLSGTPPQATGNYSANVTLRVSDGTTVVNQAFSINVSAVNDAPSFTSVPVTGATESTAYSYTATATDPESQPLTFSLTVFPTGMTIHPTTGVISWTPPEALSNYSANVTVRVSDGGVTTDQSYSISVSADNDAPSFTSSALTTATEG
ncbi:MAG: putative Ig domain-containing protein, partial [Moraxellaceae bacterium]|nr:putative Ig domain-containing protein [Moraxellaceae bacterium]